jgi:hypothetical protein
MAEIVTEDDEKVRVRPYAMGAHGIELGIESEHYGWITFGFTREQALRLADEIREKAK